MNNYEYIKVKDKDNLVRDSYSQGIINCDMDAYNAYVESYKKRYKESERINKIEGDLDGLKKDIEEIKDLLLRLSK